MTRSMLNLSTWSAENIGLLLTALLMGCDLESVLALILKGEESIMDIDTDECNLVDDEDAVCRACRPIPDDLEADAVLGLSETKQGSNAQEMWVWCPVCFDEELGKSTGKVFDKGRVFRCSECKGERGWLDDPSTINAYFTTTGDNPVIDDVPTLMDQQNGAGGTLALVPEFSTHYVPFFFGSTRKQWNTFSNLMQKVRKLKPAVAQEWLKKWQSLVGRETIGKAFRFIPRKKSVVKRDITRPVFYNMTLVRDGKLTKRQAWSVYKALCVQTKVSSLLLQAQRKEIVEDFCREEMEKINNNGGLISVGTIYVTE
jgi:hypothetical protein